MNWLSAATRISFLAALAAVLGWYYGYALVAVTLFLVALVVFSLYQLHRVQRWLAAPEQAPPDVFGIWGDLLGQIYLQQRRNREVQDRLESTVTYLRGSFAAMRDGVVMVNEQGVIEWFNEAMGPLMGLRYPEDKGQTLTNLVRAPEFNQYFVAGDYSQPLLYFINGDARCHLRVEITHFGDSERLLFVRDVTETVRLEQIRRDFVGNVSHELRTPLTVISGYLGTFLADVESFPVPYRKALQQMLQQADRMENLLKDLLWLSRIESDKGEQAQELLDIGALLEELRDELSGTHPERELRLQVETDHKVQGGYRELYSAISNLVNNAIKYSSADSPVEVSWGQSNGEYHLAVRDRGIGIDPVHFPRLTERFYRVDDSRSAHTGGTGLGLAIVKHVAASHGARLDIDSKPGEGSCFTLAFSTGG